MHYVVLYLFESILLLDILICSKAVQDSSWLHGSQLYTMIYLSDCFQYEVLNCEYQMNQAV